MSANIVTRDRTRKFKEFRKNYRPVPLGSHGFGNTDQSLLADQDQTGWDMGGPRSSLPPVWVDTFDQLNSTITKIETNIKNLERKQKDRLRLRFENDYSDQDREIEILTQTITGLIRKCQTMLKKIATIGNEEGANLPYQERAVRLNVMRAKATKVQQLSKQFRKIQKHFLEKLAGQKGTGSQFFTEDSGISLDGVDRGLTDAQMQELARMDTTASQRQADIVKIAQSVNELAQIFNELNVLVVQQGTVLDRIDYNIEQTLGQLKGAHVELKKAEKYQKRSRSTMCIIVLVVLIAFCSLILIFRNA